MISYNAVVAAAYSVYMWHAVIWQVEIASVINDVKYIERLGILRCRKHTTRKQHFSTYFDD